MVTIKEQYYIGKDKWFKIDNNGVDEKVSARMLIKAINKGLKVEVQADEEGETLEELYYIELPYIEIAHEEEDGRPIYDIYKHTLEIEDGEIKEDHTAGEGKYIKSYKTLKGALNFSKKQDIVLVVES